MEEKGKSNSFYLVFAAIILIAGITTYINLRDYKNRDRLNTQGKRVLLPIDSVAQSGSKQEVFVRFVVNEETYTATKKVKLNKSVGDTVPVYYLPGSPEVNAIVAE